MSSRVPSTPACPGLLGNFHHVPLPFFLSRLLSRVMLFLAFLHGRSAYVSGLSLGLPLLRNVCMCGLAASPCVFSWGVATGPAHSVPSRDMHHVCSSNNTTFPGVSTAPGSGECARLPFNSHSLWLAGSQKPVSPVGRTLTEGKATPAQAPLSHTLFRGLHPSPCQKVPHL